MGVFSFLGLGSSGLSPKAIEKIAKLAANPYAQPDVRREQMEKLLRDGSAEAVAGLLRRFTVSSSQAIADEDEKRYLVEQLIALGEKVVPPVKDYLCRETNLTFAAQVLMGILPRERTIQELLDLFSIYTPDDYRSDEQKRQLVLILSEEKDPRILPTLVPYLLDHSDDVRHQVLELFLTRALEKDPQALVPEVKAAMAQLIRDKDTSPRIAKRTAEIVAQLEWALPGEGEAINAALAEDFFIDKKGFLRRRVKAKTP